MTQVFHFLSDNVGQARWHANSSGARSNAATNHLDRFVTLASSFQNSELPRERRVDLSPPLQATYAQSRKTLVKQFGHNTQK